MNEQQNPLPILCFWNKNINTRSSTIDKKFQLIKVNKQALVLKLASVTSTPRASTAVQLKFLVWKLSQMNIKGLRKSFGIKIMNFSLRFVSKTVYRSLLYVFKVVMHAKSKRFHITRDICKFYLHLHRSTMFYIFLRTVQSEISYLFSAVYAFLFLFYVSR